MIWSWIRTALVAAFKLLYYPEKYRPQVVSRDGPCQCCGGKDENLIALQFERLPVTAGMNAMEGTPVIRCTCAACQYQWFRSPVSKLSYPAK